MSYEELCQAMREAGWLSHVIAAVNLKGLVSSKGLEEALTATETFKAYASGRPAPKLDFQGCVVMGARYLDAEGRHQTPIFVNHRDGLAAFVNYRDRLAATAPFGGSVHVGYLDDFPAAALISCDRPWTAPVAPTETSHKIPLRRTDYDIPYLSRQSRSEFYPQIERELTFHQLPASPWGFMTSHLPTPVWDEGRFLVTISKRDTFEIDRPFPDWRRFPPRIRAAATALRHNCEFDSFEITHHGGVLTIRRLPCPFAPTSDRHELEFDTRSLLFRSMSSAPAGIKKPVKVRVTREEYLRDPKVRAWVLQQAAGRCEGCGEKAPFETGDRLPYLEVHHLKPLEEGGTDCVTNAVALCPNCRRRCQYSREWLGFIHSIYLRLPRLVPE